MTWTYPTSKGWSAAKVQALSQVWPPVCEIANARHRELADIAPPIRDVSTTEPLASSATLLLPEDFWTLSTGSGVGPARKAQIWSSFTVYKTICVMML